MDNRTASVPTLPTPPFHSEWRGGSLYCGRVTQGGPRDARLPWAIFCRPAGALRRAPSGVAGTNEAGVVGGRTKSAVAANALPAQSKELVSAGMANDSGDRQGRPWSAGASAARPRFRTWNSVRRPCSLRSKSAVAARALPAQSKELVSAGGLVDNRMSRVPPFPSPPLHSEWKGGSLNCGRVTQGDPRNARLPWAIIFRPYQG